jgi:uncharacterized protein YbjT (DUF2867 family)
MKVAIAGASGFVGRALIRALITEGHDVVALTRSGGQDAPALRWVACDFFVQSDLEQALQGVDVAYYLIHSMLPAARLDQSRFEDTDLMLALRFGQAARAASVRRIIYLGGLLPNEGALSLHLQSRREVESALGAGGVPVTALRAGLVLGAEGSSFQMLYLLVKRLPVMLCPRWVLTPTQPIAISDVVRLLMFCLRDSRTQGRVFDVGGSDVTTYRALMNECARLLGVRRWFLHVRFFTPGLSTLWVCLVTGASRKLVAPLVQSLGHTMVVGDPELMRLSEASCLDSRSALAQCLEQARPQLGGETRTRVRARKAEKRVRSIQRFELEGRLASQASAAWIARRYFLWLQGFFYGLLRVRQTRRWRWEIGIGGLRNPLLVLERIPSELPARDCVIFEVKGGLLCHREGRRAQRLARFEFLRLPQSDVARGTVLVGLHDFYPRLPWPVYRFTQARVHLWVMRSFSAYLATRSSLRVKQLR